MHKRITLIISILLIFVALINVFFLVQYLPKKKHTNFNKFHGTLLNKPREIKPFSLTGIDNKAFSNASLHGQWSFVFFGFTQCGYLCPTTMAELAKMYRFLQEQGVKPLPRVIMISIDSKRDSLDKIAQYLKAFHPDFYGARGNEATIKEMAAEMGLAYSQVPASTGETSDHYDIQHSGAIILFNPQGELRAFFTSPHQADLLAKDYRLLVY